MCSAFQCNYMISEQKRFSLLVQDWGEGGLGKEGGGWLSLPGPSPRSLTFLYNPDQD